MQDVDGRGAVVVGLGKGKNGLSAHHGAALPRPCSAGGPDRAGVAANHR